MAEPAAGPVPQEALDYVRRKELRVGFDYRDVWLDEHAQHFTVAKVTQADVLGTLKSSFEQALERGESLATWSKNLQPELERAGWWGAREVVDTGTGEVTTTNLSSPYRLRTIYETNMRTARAAGQWQRIQRTKHALPYLIYQLGPSIEHRPEHASWAGTTLPADDPWWSTHMTPNGWGCKCNVRQVGPAEFDRLKRDGLSSPVVVEKPDGGLSTVQEISNGVPTGRLQMERKPIRTQAPPSPTKPWVNQRTGETERIPVGIDPGFNNNPGAVFRTDQVARQYSQTLTRLPSDIGAESFDLVRPRVLPVLERDFAAWGRQVLSSKRPTQTARVVGALKPDVVEQLGKRQLVPKSAAIVVRDSELLHAGRDAKAQSVTADGKPRGFTAEELLELPALLDLPQAVLLDPKSNTLLVVISAVRRDAAKLVVRLDMKLKTADGPMTVNSFRTAGLVDFADVRQQLTSGTVQLLVGKIE
jgi:hypothetical protein